MTDPTLEAYHRDAESANQEGVPAISNGEPRGPGGWRWYGAERPPFAEEPGPGQESVWDYPRPPRVEEDPRRVVVQIGATVIADSTHAVRVLETASPPTFYLPRSDVRMELLQRASGQSHCEWKGSAEYWSVLTQEGERVEQAAWSYPQPSQAFEAIRDHFAFYPGRVACFVDGERVRPQAGGFYGGWITAELVGPFKGDPGAGGW